MVVHSAYMLINKSVPSTGGPYTVRFYNDEGDLIQTDANVPQYGTAHCTLLDGTLYDGQYFKGWNPAPSAVTRNLDCYPVRGDYIIDPVEIHDSWETICQDGGAHYPLGSYKSLIVSITFTDYSNLYHEVDGITVRDNVSGGYYILLCDTPIGIGTDSTPKYYLAKTGTGGQPRQNLITVSCDMVKVAEGEDGSTSTWLSKGLCQIFPGNSSYDTSILSICKDGWFAGNSNVRQLATLVPNYITDYSDSALHYIAETMLYRILPNVLKSNIKTVNKTYKGVASKTDATSKTPLDKTILSKIWVPSRKELHTYMSQKITLAGDIQYDEEYSGIDYSTIYMPNWENNVPYEERLYLRSMVSFYGLNKYNKLGFIYNYGSSKQLRNDYNTGSDSNPILRFPFGFCL